MMEELELVAISAFGMEAIVVRELHDLGYENTTVEDGRVRFKADMNAIARCNLWLRCAERVQIVVGDFLARDFDELFDGVKELPWEKWLSVDSVFPVDARCVRSSIRSAPNSQKMVKRAIVERLRKVYMRHWFAETGVEVHVEASMFGERALLTIDTSGDGLHKRGYRKLVGPAPLRETVAAALVKLSYWSRDRLLVDPFCGSGTIPIEAALIGRNIAPGLIRNFAAEEWSLIPRSVWTQARQEARDLEDRRPIAVPIIATDHSRDAIRMTKVHARAAGVEHDIHMEKKEFYEFPTNRDYGVMITNPPYGERMGSSDEVRQLYRDMGDLLLPLDDWSLYILTAFEDFEYEFGHRADRRRKLFNARIPCTYFQYLGAKPPIGFDSSYHEDEVEEHEKPEFDFSDSKLEPAAHSLQDGGGSEIEPTMEKSATDVTSSEIESSPVECEESAATSVTGDLEPETQEPSKTEPEHLVSQAEENQVLPEAGSVQDSEEEVVAEPTVVEPTVVEPTLVEPVVVEESVGISAEDEKQAQTENPDESGRDGADRDESDKAV